MATPYPAEKTPVEVNNDLNIDALDAASTPDPSVQKADIPESREIFNDAAHGVKFRTVSWQRATIIFLKIQFAMSILAVPGALATLGAVGGALSIVGWEVLNTCGCSPRDHDWGWKREC